MAHASLSFESRIPNLARELGLSHAMVSALTNVDAGRLSQCLRGMRSLPNDEGLRIVNLLNRLIALTEAIAPLALPKSVPDILQLAKFFEGRDIERIREQVSQLFEQT